MPEDARTGTATVLFTDLVASTELRARLGEETADRLGREHDRLLGECVAAHGGTVVKGLGDGVMASFTGAADGVGAAVAIQQAVEKHGRTHPDQRFQVRVGISAGDVAWKDGDCFGTPVVEAARLCASAGAGQIFVADLVRVLARGRGGFQFDAIGELELKGLPEPVPACQVGWLPLEEGGSALPLPGLLVAGTATVYVGRRDLMNRLNRAWADAQGGASRMVLLAGEPGIGKTRAAAEVARLAHAGGASVLYGRCDESLAVPYQPFGEALSWFLSHAGDVRLAARLGVYPGELMRLDPNLGAKVPGLAEPVSSDPHTEQYRLLEAVSSWLVDASQRSGLVLVLDDLHWAAAPTLAMLVHLVRACTDDSAGARMLVVGTYRDTDLDRLHPLTGTLADLRRIPLVERIPVLPLDADEVTALVQAAAGHVLDHDALALATAVHAETEGNPFFVGEVLRHLVETGAVRREGDRWIVRDVHRLSIPEGVREVVGRRLSRLSDQANSVMSVASVLGRDLDIRVLALVVDCGEDTLLDALDEAARARIVEEAGADVWRFTHALVRSTLYEELSTTRKRRLHRKAADALEKLHPDDLTALAYHTLEAGSDSGDYHRAISYAIGAGDQALAARATGDALRLFNQALELLEEDDDDLLRSDALRGRGTAHHHGGEPGRDDLLASARLAMVAGDGARMAAALLADFGGVASNFLGGDDERIELLDAALGLLGPEDTAERAFLLTGLALELYLTPRTGERMGLGEEAVAIARRLGDPDLLTKVLVNATGGLSHPATAREALARLDELPESADAYWRVLADYWRALFLELLGDVEAAGAVIDRTLATLAAEPRPGVAWIGPFLAAGRAVMRGDLDGSAAEANRMLELMSQVGRADSFMLWAAIGVRRSLDDGTANDLVDTAINLVRDNARMLGYVEALPYLCTEAGRMDDARQALERFTLDGDLDNDFFHLADLGALGLASVALGDEVRARRAMTQLEPYADWNSSYGVWSWCSVRLVLGVLADFLGDPAAAVDHLNRAVAFAVRTSRPLEEIRARLALVAALRSAGRTGDARQEWERARDLADARGTDHLRGKVRAAAPAG